MEYGTNARILSTISLGDVAMLAAGIVTSSSFEVGGSTIVDVAVLAFVRGT